VQIEDMIAEDDKVVVCNRWTATDSQTGKKLEFHGIVIWRIAARQIAETKWGAKFTLPMSTFLRFTNSSKWLRMNSRLSL